MAKNTGDPNLDEWNRLRAKKKWLEETKPELGKAAQGIGLILLVLGITILLLW
jgi:hypothetical protein